MSDWIDIDGADYLAHEYNGQMYYVGEETILDSDHQEIGYICCRGPQCVVAATKDGKTVAQRLFTGPEGEVIESEDDVIRIIFELHESVTTPPGYTDDINH